MAVGMAMLMLLLMLTIGLMLVKREYIAMQRIPVYFLFNLTIFKKICVSLSTLTFIVAFNLLYNFFSIHLSLFFFFLYSIPFKRSTTKRQNTFWLIFHTDPLASPFLVVTGAFIPDLYGILFVKIKWYDDVALKSLQFDYLLCGQFNCSKWFRNIDVAVVVCLKWHGVRWQWISFNNGGYGRKVRGRCSKIKILLNII